MLLLFGSTAESVVLDAPEVEAGGFPRAGGTVPLPVLGDDDKAAMLTPVLLAGFFDDSFAVSSFFDESCFDFPLFPDLEEDVVEVDLSSLALLAASLFEVTLARCAAFAARALASLALGDLIVLATVGDGLNAGIGNCRASGDD